MNRVTIYRAKCLGILTLKALPKSCFCYNSEEKNHKFLDPKNEAKQNYQKFLCASAIIKCLEDFEKMKDFSESFCIFTSKLLRIHFNFSQKNSLVLLLNGLAMPTNEGLIACKCFK